MQSVYSTAPADWAKIRSKVQLKKIIAKNILDNDIFDDVTLRDIGEEVSVMMPAQVEIEKAKILANMTIEKARIEQET